MKRSKLITATSGILLSGAALGVELEAVAIALAFMGAILALNE